VDVLVAMNPAALKVNLKILKKGGIIIADSDGFDPKNLNKINLLSNPLEDESLSEFKLIKAPITSLTKKSVEGLGLDTKSQGRCKNMFALGIMYWLFNRNIDPTVAFIDQKFKKNTSLGEANKKALFAGYHFGETIEASPSFTVKPARISAGKYRQITGNTALAWGLLAASERTGKNLFFGSYPITPASDILHELSRFKNWNAKTFQAEDEIAAICSAIGASYAGDIGVTSTAGPGFSLKAEAMGLAIMTELPLVIINVQRGGPSTGLPTKMEQADLLQALYGRHAESPLIVIAPSTPSNCFEYAYRAVKLSIEHMTPVVILSDAYLANGSEPWKIPSVNDFPSIQIPVANLNGEEKYLPYLRNKDTLSRSWVVPGTKGMEHRIGGLEKEDKTGNVSYDAINHENMIRIREEKVARVANYIPEQTVIGSQEGELLVVGWGGTYGSLLTAVKELQAEGKSVSLAHFNYLNPLPKNTKQVLGSFKAVLVCELNTGQFAHYLRASFPEYKYEQYNKIQGLPFGVSELKEKIKNSLL
jgi:2-oxoglutarate ferredoxin oxidoreductase subunit alpha